MIEQEAEDKWVLQHYTPTVKCQECHQYFFHNRDSPLSYKETLTKLKEHSLHEHKVKHNSVQNIENDVNKEKIPVRRFIRKLYSKLKGDLAKCNSCFAIISYKTGNYRFLHEHLICKHEDKLTEIQKNDKRIQWYWDCYTINNRIHAKCKICNKKFTSFALSTLKLHLRTHKKTRPSSSSDTDDGDSDTDMGTSAKRATRPEDTYSLQNRMVIMAKPIDEDEWVLQFYVPTLMCHKCNVSFWSDTDNILSSEQSEETLTKLKEHLLHEHNINHDSVHDVLEYDINKEKIPVRRFMRKHYSILKGNAAKCNYCFVVISYSNNNYTFLHEHLKCKHENKLKGIEKNENRLQWTWDYFTVKDKMSATCNICKRTITVHSASYNLTLHLNTHKKTAPSSSSNTDDTDDPDDPDSDTDI